MRTQGTPLSVCFVAAGLLCGTSSTAGVQTAATARRVAPSTTPTVKAVSAVQQPPAGPIAIASRGPDVEGIDFRGETAAGGLDLAGIDFIGVPVGSTDVTGLDFLGTAAGGAPDVVAVDFVGVPVGGALDVSGVDFVGIVIGASDVTGVDFLGLPVTFRRQ